jgi:hypothetical protein
MKFLRFMSSILDLGGYGVGGHGESVRGLEESIRLAEELILLGERIRQEEQISRISCAICLDPSRSQRRRRRRCREATTG